MDQVRRSWARRDAIKTLLVASQFFLFGCGRSPSAKLAEATKEWSVNASVFKPNVDTLGLTLRRAAAGTARFHPRDFFKILPLNPSRPGPARQEANRRSAFAFENGLVSNSGPIFNQEFVDDGIGRVSVKIPPTMRARYTSTDASFRAVFEGASLEISLWDIPTNLNMPRHYSLESLEHTPTVFSMILYNGATDKRLKLNALLIAETGPDLSQRANIKEGDILFPSVHQLDKETAMLVASQTDICCNGLCQNPEEGGLPYPEENWWIALFQTQPGTAWICTVAEEEDIQDSPSNYVRKYGAFKNQEDALDYLSDVLDGKCENAA